MNAFGVPVTVTRPAPNNTPISTTGIWVLPAPDPVPMGGDLRRREPTHVLALSRADVPTMPSATSITAPERLGGTVKTWKFDRFDSEADPDYWRVRLVL
jgi:hypothetical protein